MFRVYFHTIITNSLWKSKLKYVWFYCSLQVWVDRDIYYYVSMIHLRLPNVLRPTGTLSLGFVRGLIIIYMREKWNQVDFNVAELISLIYCRALLMRITRWYWIPTLKTTLLTRFLLVTRLVLFTGRRLRSDRILFVFLYRK